MAQLRHILSLSSLLIVVGSLLLACLPASITAPTLATTPTAAPTSPVVRLATPRAEERWTVYHPDPQHLWNRLFRQLFRRTTSDGVEYGWDSLDPLLWYETTHLLDEPAYSQTIRVLDEFLSTRGEELIADPLKRAMLQRDLWAVFDWASLRTNNYSDRRQAFQQRLAQIIRKLALTREEIQSLPDNTAAAVSSGAFPATYQNENPEAAFLPPDLFKADGEWVCIGREGGPIAMTHTEEFPFFGRSAFLVFIRAPGGREAALRFLQQLNAGNVPAGSLAGVEVALVRRMMLIDDQGRPTLSPLVESAQIRHFSSHGQNFFEFRLSRDLLFAGEAGGLRPRDKDLMLFRSHGDWIQSGYTEEVTIPEICAACHVDAGMGIAGILSILSYSRERFPLPDHQQPVLTETTPELEAQAVIAWKLKQDTWQALQAAWR